MPAAKTDDVDGGAAATTLFNESSSSPESDLSAERRILHKFLRPSESALGCHSTVEIFIVD